MAKYVNKFKLLLLDVFGLINDNFVKKQNQKIQFFLASKFFMVDLEIYA